MSQVPVCNEGATQNPDGTLSCPGTWLLVDLPAPDPIHEISAEQMHDMTVSIFLAFATAFAFRMLFKFIITTNYGRN